MQLCASLFSTLGVLVIAGTVTAAAAEMDASKCAGNAKQWQAAFNKGDTSAVAGLYTPDAVEVTPSGIQVGPAAVKSALTKASRKGGSRTW